MESKLQKYFQKYQIKDISFDSRNLKEGDAFFALKGERFDGNNYIDAALKNKAAVVFTDNPAYQKERVIYIDNIRLALAIASGMIYPKLPRHLMAVTGTNGKTSVASYVQQIIAKLGAGSASIGTLGIIASKQLNSLSVEAHSDSGLNTPDPVIFRKILQTLAEENIQNVIFEASSHGLHQLRIGDIKVNSAAFTSFSQDHLEYHKTMQDYLEAKLLLFTNNLSASGEAIINSEISYSDFIIKFLRQKNINFTTVGPNGDLKITACEQSLLGQSVECEFNGKTYNFYTNIIGSFQATNLLIAAKIVANAGFKFEDVIRVIPEIKAVPGRLQRITDENNDFQVFVDYAHTPDALEKSLQELKAVKNPEGKLALVFGCGGDRDTLKRPIMGKIASRLADIAIVTDDNPRTEDAAKIRKEIIMGAPEISETGDREKAINNAIANLKKNDILLVAGKGHENYQIIGDKKYHFSDAEVVGKALLKK
jgi:UDP-N-acetylmuramoyl-L-alanyl-D-glutamate--2,6-diaminopimelate ligase